MTNPNPVNIAASVKQKLLNFSKAGNRDFNQVLYRYAFERFLYRLSISQYADRLILKGAMLFHVWGKADVRPTKDMDFLGYNLGSADGLRTAVENIIATGVLADGILFDRNTIEIEDIREQNNYKGLRVTFISSLGRARILLQLDVGFGNAVEPEPEIVSYPSMLGFPSPMIRAYVRESSIAEKLHAILQHGILNSRIKDYFDIWYMSANFKFAGNRLFAAIKSTLEHEKTSLPENVPEGLSNGFSSNPQSSGLWKAFIRKNKLSGAPVELFETVSCIREFLMPVLNALLKEKMFDKEWPPVGPWV
jgi:predicted nucleotidyltransferase component of viral defense system